LKFGHFCLPTYFSDVDGSVGDFTRRFVDFLADSEELGFDSLWANEHHFDPYGGIIPSPPIMLAALAQRTKRVRLGTSVIVLPLHQPIEIAEQLAMVDLISNGRVDLGVGRGFVVADYEALGIPRDGAQERLMEELEVILKAWSGAPFSHHGTYYNFDNIEVWPPPQQQRPHPPVWLSVGATPASFEWAGRHGYKVLTVAYRGVQQLVELLPLYRNAWLAAGHKAGEWEISSHYQVVLSDNSRKARQIAEKALRRYMAATTHTIERAEAHMAAPEAAERSRVDRDMLDIDRMVDECRVIAGTPDEAVQSLERARDMMGLTQADCTFYFGGIPFGQAQRSQRLFASEVMPKLRKETFAAVS